MTKKSNMLKKSSLAGIIGLFTAVFLHLLLAVNEISFSAFGVQFHPWMLYMVFPVGEMVGYFIVLHIFSHVRVLVEASRFAIVGFFNFVLDVSLLSALSQKFDIYSGAGIILLNIIAGSVAVLNSYYWNRKFTFQKQTDANVGEFGAFLFVSIVGLVINTTVLFILTTFVTPFAGITEEQFLTLAKIISIFISLFWNFFGYKLFVFKKRTQERVA